MQTRLSVAEAQRIVLEQSAVLAPERVARDGALGRVLAERVRAGRTHPPADVSAMDGFAVRSSDLAAASAERPVRLQVVFAVAAGARAERKLAAGEAARILTGAPLPEGADAVVRQEDVEHEGEAIRVARPVAPGEDVRPAGEDYRAGEVVLERGERLRPAHLGLLAALGRSVVAVHRRPRVAILSSGDELIEPDGDPSGGRIVASNSYSLAAQCREAGAEPVYLGIARDDPEDLAALLRAGAHADVVVSSAGVSVGDRDYVRPVLERLGCQLRFWGVRMKPGFPVTFGRFGETGPLVFGLPGNPVSAMVTFEQFVRPALRRMAGHRRLFRPLLEAEVTETLRKPPGRLHFVRVRLAREGARLLATPTGSQSSGVLRSMTLAQGLLLFPADAEELVAGARARVQLLDEDFLAAADAGV